MSQEEEEPWQKLCQQAATEQDSKKLLALVERINRILEKKTTHSNSIVNTPE